MNQHRKNLLMGLGVGLVVPFASLFIYWLFTWRNFDFMPDFFVFMHKHKKVASHLALACLTNLPIFYVLINKDKYKFAQGIIFGTLLYAFYIFYYKLFVAVD